MKIMRLRSLFIISLMFIAIYCYTQPSGLKVQLNSALGKTNELSQYGITWNFSEEVEFGKFVNGDYWVMGPVTVNSVTPEPGVNDVSNKYVNGSMIDPLVGSESEGAGQAYDERAFNWNETHVLNFPLTVNPEKPVSLISTISLDPTNPDRPGRTCLYTAAVLTIVSQEPPADGFRPGLVAGDKKIFRAGDIDLQLLPSLDPVPSMPNSSDISEHYVPKFKRPWILHGTSWSNAAVKPQENMDNYHRDIARDLGYSLILLMADWGDRTELLYNFLQVAIDYYAVADGGPGRGTRGTYQMPVIFAGMLFGDNDMRDIYINVLTSTPDYFHPDSNQGSVIYWYGEQNRTQYSNLIDPISDTWTRYNSRTGETAVFHGVNISGGNAGAHEHLDPSEWHWIEEAGYDGGGEKQEVYRRQNSASAVAFGLAAILLNAESYFDNTAYVPYVDRWMSETEDIIEYYGGSTSGAHSYMTSGSDFVDEMWQTYR